MVVFSERIFVVIFLLGILVTQVPAQETQFKSLVDVQSSFQKNAQPFLKKHCDRCHNKEEMESGISVDHLDGSLANRNLFLWKEIEEQVAGGNMPPEDEPQPNPAEVGRLKDWIHRAEFFAKSRPQPKNGSARRLTVTQYKNALRQLLGIQEDVATTLPPDAVSKDGFLNNEKSMLLSPLLVEAYFDIAQKALDQAIVNVKEKPTIQNFKVEFGKQLNKEPYPKKLILGANSHLLQNEDFVVTEMVADKPFEFEPFKMQRRFRFIEGYQGNSTVRGWRDFDSLYHAVFACMRGNGGYPKGLAYESIPEGLLLRPAIPSRELFGVESTYGPKANFKIAVRELPENGHFVVKVKAQKYIGGLLLDRGQKVRDQESEDPLVVAMDSGRGRLSLKRSGVYQVKVRTVPKGLVKAKSDATNLEQNLVGGWSFEHGWKSDPANKDHDSNDRVRIQLHGEKIGKAQLVDSPFGKSLSLDGKDSSFKVKRHPSMNVGEGEFSVAAWIKPTELRQAGIFCLGKYSWTHGWYFDMPNNRGVLRIETAKSNNQPNGTVQSRPGVIRANRWQHVAAVVSRQKNETRLYVNGYEVARGTIPKANLDNLGTDLYIGRIQDSVHFKGEIDEVKFYDRLLTEGEIQALLEPGRSFVQPPPPGQPKPINLTVEDHLGTKSLSGVLYQPEFAFVRLAAGEVEFRSAYKGNQDVSEIELLRLDEKSQSFQRFAAFESRMPKLGVYVGLRRDCGHTLKQVGSPVELQENAVEYRFEGAINNYPSPDIEKNNVNYLAGMREIGVRSEYTDGRDMPRLLLQSVEFEGPYYEQWPPQSHTQIFFESPHRSDPKRYALEIISRFAQNAFRRPATSAELRSLQNVFDTSFAQTRNFHASVKDALLVVLTSPQFLFQLEQSQTPKAESLTEYELASKLSFFLWNSPPDARLMKLAARRELSSTLGEEIDRMIDHPRFDRFCESFGTQWLQLDKFDVVEIDRKKFPRLTRYTKRELRREPIEFLKYLIQKDLAASNLVDSDFMMVNEVTSTYYELKSPVESGFSFLPIKAEREELGGLLGQVAILSGLSDGREANPIKRGAWLARKIIAEPPDDPPPNVPELGEDTSHLPLRERLALHRNQKGCAGCHSGIDPWGLPFEQFDAGGRFFAEDNQNALSELPDKTEINGFLALRKYLAEDRMDQVAFSFVKHLATYAVGRTLTYNEIETLKVKCLELKSDDYSMRDIFRFVVNSPMFREK